MRNSLDMSSNEMGLPYEGNCCEKIVPSYDSLAFYAFNSSISASHKADTASLGIRQSPRGDRGYRANFRAVGQTGAFELLIEETAEEGAQPM